MLAGYSNKYVCQYCSHIVWLIRIFHRNFFIIGYLVTPGHCDLCSVLRVIGVRNFCCLQVSLQNVPNNDDNIVYNDGL